MTTIQEKWEALGLDSEMYNFGDQEDEGLELHIRNLCDFGLIVPKGSSCWRLWGFTKEGAEWAEHHFSSLKSLWPHVKRYEVVELMLLNRARELFPGDF